MFSMLEEYWYCLLLFFVAFLYIKYGYNYLYMTAI